MSLVEVRDDVGGYEILEMNSAGMFSCQNSSLDEAENVLSAALTKLSQDDQATNDPTFADRLKAITHNNLGVVYCHKGQPRKALEHLESAFATETRLGVSSPSTTLNLCAAHNSMKHYEKATQFALQTIDALHRVPQQELEDHKVLWGAAWHNLGIAQLNTGGSNLDDASTVFAIFKNAMEATQELLGPKHPMTIAVHQTYRELRERLKESGVFSQHRGIGTPRGSSRGGGGDGAKDITVTLVGPDRYRYQQTTSGLPYVKPERPGSQQSPRKHMTASQRFSRRLQTTLKTASGVYSEMHPLLSSKKRHSGSTPFYGRPDTSEGSPRSARLGGSPQGSPRLTSGPTSARGNQASNLPPLPTPPNSSHGRKGSPPQPKRRLSELLLGDMWVDVNGNSTQSFLSNLPNSPNPEQRKNYYPPVRPNYAGNAMHVMGPEEMMEGMPTVVDPQSNATLDHQHTSSPPMTSQIAPLGQADASQPAGATTGGGGQLNNRAEEYSGLSALAQAMGNQSSGTGGGGTDATDEFQHVRHLAEAGGGGGSGVQ